MPLSDSEILTFCRSAAKADPYAAKKGELFAVVVDDIAGSGFRITRRIRDKVDVYLQNMQTKARQGIDPAYW